jgi:anti-anti-sigma regulatory factor
MVSCNGLMEQSGGQMRIAGARGSVAKSFDLVHLDRIAALDPDVESAGRHLAGGAAAV